MILCKHGLFPDWNLLDKGTQEHKNLQYFKERLFCIYPEFPKTHNKYIALGPAGVVQHRLLAG